MSKIETLRSFLATCPLLAELSAGSEIHIDWTADNAQNAGIQPGGEHIISKKQNIFGEVFYKKQYKAVLFIRFVTANDLTRLQNAEFFENFTDWLEDRQAAGEVPVFGNCPDEEDEITAENAILFDEKKNGTEGIYQVQITKIYTEKI